MPFATRPLVLVTCALIAFPGAGRGEDLKPSSGPACRREAVSAFETDVWESVASVRCLQCHQEGGDAEESALVLRDTRKLEGSARDDAIRSNRDALARLARVNDG